MLLKIGLGAAFWGIMFLGVSAIMVTPLPLLAQHIIEIIIAAAAGFVLGKVYFKKHPADLKQGAITAVVWLVVATMLDLLVTVQYVRLDGTYVDGLKNLYGQWPIWVSFIVFIATTALAAKMTHGGALMRRPMIKPQAPPVPPTSPQPPFPTQ